MSSRSATTSPAYSPLMPEETASSRIIGERRARHLWAQPDERHGRDYPGERRVGPQVIRILGHRVDIPVKNPEQQDRPQCARGRPEGTALAPALDGFRRAHPDVDENKREHPDGARVAVVVAGADQGRAEEKGQDDQHGCERHRGGGCTVHRMHLREARRKTGAAERKSYSRGSGKASERTPKAARGPDEIGTDG